MATGNRDALFKHYNVTREMICQFSDRMGAESHTHRVAKGQSLAWKFGKFTLGKGKSAKRETRAYAVYVNASGQPVDPVGNVITVNSKKLPALKIIGPPAPTRGIWLNMRSALKPPPNTTQPIERSSQSIDLDEKCTDENLFPQWVSFCKEMTDFCRDKRCRALVEHVQEHDFFDDDFRESAENDPERAIQQLLAAHDSVNDSSQNPCRFWNAKRTVFRERREDGNMMKISPRDQEILKIVGFDPLHDDGPFEGKPKIQTFLETSPRFWELNLMQINSPRKGDKVHPSEYKRLNRGGVASVEITVFGMYERVDGKKRQIGISVANTGCSIFNNGPSETQETAQTDVMDILMASEPAEIVRKKMRIEVPCSEDEDDNEIEHESDAHD